ncbi:MAG: prohibitin family protein [Clostridia bacterium]|nr:prohibitin family protein [Clostridia bacterium]
MQKAIGAIVVAVVIFLVITLLGGAFVTIPAGFVGVKTQFGAVVGSELQPGLHFKVPVIQGINKIDCRIQKIEVATSAASKDLQTVTSKVAVNFAVRSDKATELYQEVGKNYETVIIEPAVFESVKMATSQYTAEELLSKRSEVSSKMLELLIEKVAERGINVNDVNVVDFDFSAEFNYAIEQKQVAQQNALKASQDLERVKIEAEQKVVQAKAEADALKLRKEEITKELLVLEAIQKWDGKLPTYMGSDEVPFLSVR